jgi:hypothetical protein
LQTSHRVSGLVQRNVLSGVSPDELATSSEKTGIINIPFEQFAPSKIAANQVFAKIAFISL